MFGQRHYLFCQATQTKRDPLRLAWQYYARQYEPNFGIKYACIVYSFLPLPLGDFITTNVGYCGAKISPQSLSQRFTNRV